MERIKKCRCGKSFSYKIGRGLDRIYCSKECAVHFSNLDRVQKIKNNPECLTVGCNKRISRPSYGLCEACYMRLRRRGTTDYREYPRKSVQSGGYIRIRDKDHKLADSKGRVYEHRYVYYQHNGDDLHIDHLDDNVDNNEISNLVASCPICNQKRGRHKMISNKRMNGRMITYGGKTMCVSEWAKYLGLSRSAFFWRINNWELDDVMNRPRGVTGPSGVISPGDELLYKR